MLDCEAEKAVADALVSSPTKKKSFKKPAAATNQEKKKAPKTKEKKEADPQQGQKKKLKSSFRHRKTSQVYHKEKNLQEKMGASPTRPRQGPGKR